MGRGIRGGARSASVETSSSWLMHSRQHVRRGVHEGRDHGPTGIVTVVKKPARTRTSTEPSVCDPWCIVMVVGPGR